MPSLTRGSTRKGTGKDKYTFVFKSSDAGYPNERVCNITKLYSISSFNPRINSRVTGMSKSTF